MSQKPDPRGFAAHFTKKDAQEKLAKTKNKEMRIVLTDLIAACDAVMYWRDKVTE